MRSCRIAGGVLLLAALAWFVLLWAIPPPDPYRVKPPGRQVFARDGKLLRAFLSPDQKWRLRTPLADISPRLVQAVIEHEDRWFRRHGGVNPVSVVRSLAVNLRAGRVVTGASTITMQLARLVEPERRSLSYKLFQTFRALQYEWKYSKDEILEMYLNLAPYGGNIEGIGAASYLYFDKPPHQLSWAEACLLAVLPQSPSARHPARHPEAALAARNRLIERLRARGRIDPIDAAQASAQRIASRTFSLPFTAPHFCEWVTRLDPHPINLRTTLDYDLQAQAESLLHSHIQQLAPSGIHQGAIAISDYESAELLVMVGSASFFDSLHAGQVNGALAPRSPGSALKPFVYALAFERGLATPSTLLEDVPVRLGSYRPENFDGTFCGAISAGRALRTSRNVPAIVLASRLQPTGSFHEWLRRAGVSSLNRPAEHYGLSLVLGGGDVTLLELTGLYGSLARQGVRRPLRVLDGAARSDSSRILTPEASYLTLQALIDVQRPELDRVWRSGVNQIPIPWKTGTSYRHRDAWSVGIAGCYVVAVWLGNFDGVASPHLVGRRAAAPLLFDLVDILPRGRPGSWHRRPTGLRRREVCSLSGAAVSPHCPEVRSELYIPGVSPAMPCRLHRQIMIDKSSGKTVCTRCRSRDGWESRVVTWWPPRLATFMAAHGDPNPAIPPHNPLCPALAAHEPPAIVSPQQDMEYYLRAGVPFADQKIALLASADNGSHELYWFLNGELIWKGPPGETGFWQPVPGRYLLTVKDDAGRQSSTSFAVVN